MEDNSCYNPQADFMLSFNNLSLRRGSKLLFENVSFTVHKNNKVGLVGTNGTGKTSLFKMIKIMIKYKVLTDI